MDSSDTEAVIARERAATASRAAALARQVAELAEVQAHTTHDDEHDPEGVTVAYERAHLQGLLAGARREIEALDRAADRLEAGTYGRCRTCGEPIGPERLDALPSAETCIACAPRRRR
ncbi:MAG: TraR/DksA C4-type zinc finger protein [Pseudonocardia sp.]|nr:TraR/DksA C4-type zinc finger protein [Pseudonocardia sp.]